MSYCFDILVEKYVKLDVGDEETMCYAQYRQKVSTRLHILYNV